MLGSFSCFSSRLLTIIKNKFFKKFFQNTIRVSNSLALDQDQHSVGPDLGPNCLQILSAKFHLLYGIWIGFLLQGYFINLFYYKDRTSKNCVFSLVAHNSDYVLTYWKAKRKFGMKAMKRRVKSDHVWLHKTLCLWSNEI